MAETKKTTRRDLVDVQRELKCIVRTRPPNTNELAPTSRQTKRKGTQEIAENGETVAKDRGKKRARKDPPSYLQRSYDAGNDPNHSIRLLTIPREVFDEIMSFLEPDAVTCLSLTCKAILSILGRKLWAECRSKRRHFYKTSNSWRVCFRDALLSIIVRDAPHLTFCNTCMTLHPPLRPPWEHRPTQLTILCLGPWSAIDYLPHDEHGRYTLLWEHVVEARRSLNLDSANEVSQVLGAICPLSWFKKLGDFTPES